MEKIIDKYLTRTESQALNRLPEEIEAEMADPNQDEEEEWRTWFPIASKVTDDEIHEFEGRLGHHLPPAFIRFLKHKHFYELQISECSFCPHPVRTWRYGLSVMIFEGWDRTCLLDTGRIPFASWSDWGMLCFDTTAHCKDNNYPIVFWDHEASDQFTFQSIDFEQLLVELDKEEMERNV